jgi:hypothetical protein
MSSALTTPLLWGRRDLNPHALRHMILSHARLPIPTLPRQADYTTGYFFAKHRDNALKRHEITLKEQGWS